MANAEREPITGVWGGAPSGVQEQSPCRLLVRGEAPEPESLSAFQRPMKAAKMYPSHCVWQTECL